jgi:Copper amine oxidase N-terminal domain.
VGKCCRMMLLLALMMTCFSGIASANTASGKTISVTVNGVKQNYTVSPIMVNGSVMVPLRAILESLGANLTYDAGTQEIEAKKYITKVTLKVGSKVAKINGKELKLDQPPLIREGVAYVPVRFVSEAFGANVEWDPKASAVIIRFVDIFMLDDAIREDDLDKFTELLNQAKDKTLANRAIYYTLQYKRDAQWVEAALRAGADVFFPYDLLEYSVAYKRADVVKLLLDGGYVDSTERSPSSSNLSLGSSYIGLAYRKTSVNTFDTKGRLITMLRIGPSIEIAEMLYDKGFRAETTDAFEPLILQDTEWFDWMLAHGADPNGEVHWSVKHIAPEMPDGAAVRLIHSAYYFASRDPDPENMQNFATLVLKYGASLEPLTQAQKDLMLDLAKDQEMHDLVEALKAAGAKEAQ